MAQSITIIVTGNEVTVSAAENPLETKTTLRSQLDFIRSLDELNRPAQVKRLRAWLGKNGYEPAYKNFAD